MKKLLYLLMIVKFLLASTFLVELNSTSKPTGDDTNSYFYTKHFRVIIAKSAVDQYKNEISLVETTLENVYDYEILKYGFKIPPGGDKYYIDVYLGQVGTVNLETGEEVNPSPYYPTGVGEGKYYSNGVFYFNLYLENLEGKSNSYIQGIIAHEFFHGVQRAYHFDESPTASNNWEDGKNRWFGESTAVFVGNDIFANNYNIDSVIQNSKYYNPYVTNYINYPLEENENQDEYQKDIIWIYIAKQYGLDKAFGFLKNILQNYYNQHPNGVNTSDIGNDRILNYVIDSSKSYLGIEFKDLLARFGVWLVKNNFNVPYNINVNIGQFGMAFFNNAKYIAVNSPLYCIRDITNDKNNTVSNNVVLLNPNETLLNSSIINNLEVKSLSLIKGWNLIGNIYNDKIPMDKIDGVIIWVYRNNKFLGYSKYANIQQALKENNLFVNNPYINPGEGFFIYEDKNKTLDLYTTTNDLYISSDYKLQAIKYYDTNNSYYVFKDNIWQKPQKIYPFEVIYKGE